MCSHCNFVVGSTQDHHTISAVSFSHWNFPFIFYLISCLFVERGKKQFCLHELCPEPSQPIISAQLPLFFPLCQANRDPTNVSLKAVFTPTTDCPETSRCVVCWFRAWMCCVGAHTHHTSSLLTECRCFGFSRVIVTVGALKYLPTTVSRGTRTSVSHLFLKQSGWNCIAQSLPLSSLFPSFLLPTGRAQIVNQGCV